jgi:LysM repeat protein
VATPRTYAVTAGDTLFGIAAQFGLTVEQLLAANPQITNADYVTIGQVIVIPDRDFQVPRSPAATP